MQKRRIVGSSGDGNRRRDGEVIALVARAIAIISIAYSHGINSTGGMWLLVRKGQGHKERRVTAEMAMVARMVVISKIGGMRA